MAPDDRDGYGCGERTVAKYFCDKGGCTNDVEGGDTEKSGKYDMESALLAGFGTIPFWVKDIVLFEDFGNDGDGGVYRVGDNEHKCLRGCGGNSRSEVPDDPGIDLSARD